MSLELLFPGLVQCSSLPLICSSGGGGGFMAIFCARPDCGFVTREEVEVGIKCCRESEKEGRME